MLCKRPLNKCSQRSRGNVRTHSCLSAIISPRVESAARYATDWRLRLNASFGKKRSPKTTGGMLRALASAGPRCIRIAVESKYGVDFEAGPIYHRSKNSHKPMEHQKVMREIVYRGSFH